MRGILTGILAVGCLAALSSGVEITNPGELISQLLTGNKPDEIGPALVGRQNLGAYNSNRRRPPLAAPKPAYQQNYAPSYEQPQQQQQQQPAYEASETTVDIDPPNKNSNNNAAAPAELVDEQPEINNAYQSAPAKPQYSVKPTSYDPTPYADTLYCLDCQDKCGLQLAPQCPTGRGWYKHANSCYYFEPSIQLAWREARGFCAGLTDETGQQRGHLAIINDARENEYLRSLNHYLQKGGFPTMFWIDLATLLVPLNTTSGMNMTATAMNVTANANATANATTAAATSANIPVEWFTYQANGFVSSFRSMFNLFAQAMGMNLCGLIEYFGTDAIEAMRLQSELYWALDNCASQRPPLCEINLDGNPFN